jgi:hypothetical protein
MKLRAAIAALGCVAFLAPAAHGATLPDATIKARQHFFGAENVAASGEVRSDRFIMSWFSVGSFAAAIHGHVVLLDTYIHKGEDQPGYVPTTTNEIVALAPEAVIIGHGHFDHANTAGQVVVRTGAELVGTPEHCDQTKAQAADYAGHPVDVRCIATVDRGSEPGAQVREIRPLGDDVCVTVLKHVHSAAEPADADHTNPQLVPPPLVNPNQVLFHPPGPSVIGGLDPAGDEGFSLLYQFRVGRFALVWADTAGPLRELAPKLPDVMRRLPPTDVEFNAVLGFNNPTNGVRDPVDYVAALQPKVMYPDHHDFVAEYGSGDYFEQYMRREMDSRGVKTEMRWLHDPVDYIRPGLTTFDPTDPRWAQDSADRPSGDCGCPDRTRQSFKLHRVPGTRVVRVEAFVNGRRTLVRTGTDVRRIALSGLPQTGPLKVRIVATHSSGAKVVSTRSWNGCTKGPPKIRVIPRPGR